MRIEDFQALKDRGVLFCPKCGYGLLGFIQAPDGRYAWCPNCERDNGSGGALSGAIDGVDTSEDLNPSTMGR